MTRRARFVLLTAVAATLGLLVLATATGSARIGPAVVWVVHHDQTADGSEVRLRPGLALGVAWIGVGLLVWINRRDR